MNKLILKTATGIAAVGLLFATMAPAAFADVEISGNGSGSSNGVSLTVSNLCKVKQSSNTTAVTTVTSSASTGGNTASSNTGGSVTIDTGDATSTVETTVTGGSNVAVDPCCGCEPAAAPDVLISGNGENTSNGVTLAVEAKKVVKQKSNTTAVTTVTSRAKTGKNKAKYNTGEGANVAITTGGATSSVTTSVTGGSNSL